MTGLWGPADPVGRGPARSRALTSPGVVENREMRDSLWLRGAPDFFTWCEFVTRWSAHEGRPIPAGDDLDRLALLVEGEVNACWLPGLTSWEMETGLIRGPWPEVWTLEDEHAFVHAFARHGLDRYADRAEPDQSLLALTCLAMAAATAAVLDDHRGSARDS